MQRILDAVSRGYGQYTSGVVPIHKAAQLYGKFAELYGVHFNANQRAYAKRKKRANARLFFLYEEDSVNLSWWLFATGGTGQVHELEQQPPYPLSWEEQRKLFKELAVHLKEMALFAVNTGCRDQEICNLRWDWEIRIPLLKSSVFIVPGEYVKNR